MKVEDRQKAFFDENAKILRLEYKPDKFKDQINYEIIEGLKWLSNCKCILDYGCGTGTTMDEFVRINGSHYDFLGVDISQTAIDNAISRYPNSKFIIIRDNNLSELSDSTVDGAYIMHVLHHAEDHSKIISELSRVLRNSGKLFISDLTSNNPFIKFGRWIFEALPMSVKNLYNDDLNVNGSVPEKLKVDTILLLDILKCNSFEICEVQYGHVFSFLVVWVDKFLSTVSLSVPAKIVDITFELDRYLSKSKFFYKFAEVVAIKAIKYEKL